MFRNPRIVLPFKMLVDYLPTRDTEKIAKHLGVTASTVEEWISQDNAPWMAHQALHWETKFGIDQLYTHAINGQARYYALSQSLEQKIKELQERISYLEATADFGAANAPIYKKA